MKPVANLDELEFSRTVSQGEKFAAKLAPVGTLLGAKMLGYNVTSVPPGKRAFPFHNHHANEEMFLVLDGTGTLRFGNQEYGLRAGDVIGCPCGGRELAHQIVNTGSTELRYLSVSTMAGTDVCEYPDSGKFAATAGRLPGTRMADAPFAVVAMKSACVDYYHGEDG
jgi:uncharacterized cupin superfamily protein